jgi:hypothetical protein
LNALGLQDHCLISRTLVVIVQKLTCAHFNRPDAVFVLIIPIDLLDRQRSIRISLPTPAEVHWLKNPPDAIFSRKPQGNGIILTVADIGKRV